MSSCGSSATGQLERCLIALLGSCGFVWAHGQDGFVGAWVRQQTEKFRKNALINV